MFVMGVTRLFKAARTDAFRWFCPPRRRRAASIPSRVGLESDPETLSNLLCRGLVDYDRFGVQSGAANRADPGAHHNGRLDFLRAIAALGLGPRRLGTRNGVRSHSVRSLSEALRPPCMRLKPDSHVAKRTAEFKM